jgi:GNAT superfamily N-acetyltransferase
MENNNSNMGHRGLNLSFRRADKRDLDALLSLIIEGDIEGKKRDQKATFELISKMICKENQHILIAELDGKIVAMCNLVFYCSLNYEQGKKLVIESLRVSKDHAGKGIGTAILERAKRAGKYNNACTIELNFNGKRDDMSNFYSKSGFAKGDLGVAYFPMNPKE